MNELLAGIATYAAPLLGIGFLKGYAKLRRGLIVTLFLGAPALACLTYVLWLRQNGIDIESSLWREFFCFYPFSILPLGLWVICLALLGSLLVSHTSLGTDFKPWLVGLGSALIGAFVGGGFLGLYAVLANTGEANFGQPLLSAWVVAGMVAGGASGAIVGTSSVNHRREQYLKASAR
jgi:hypothetical protein